MELQLMRILTLTDMRHLLLRKGKRQNRQNVKCDETCSPKCHCDRQSRLSAKVNYITQMTCRNRHSWQLWKETEWSNNTRELCRNTHLIASHPNISTRLITLTFQTVKHARLQTNQDLIFFDKFQLSWCLAQPNPPCCWFASFGSDIVLHFLLSLATHSIALWIVAPGSSAQLKHCSQCDSS